MELIRILVAKFVVDFRVHVVVMSVFPFPSIAFVRVVFENQADVHLLSFIIGVTREKGNPKVTLFQS